MAGLWSLRWIVVVLAATLGVVLVLSGYWLIGALVLALAVARAALLVGVRRRRSRLEDRWRRFGPPGGARRP